VADPAARREALDRFTAELSDRAAADPRVLGLVLLGSFSGQGAPADEWSDHDFFLVVRPGTQEAFRGDLSWMPGADRIALSYRETAHGGKALFEDGRLAEFAVFEPEELAVARVNRYRVVLDRERIGQRMAGVAAANRSASKSEAPGDAWLFGQFLTALSVGYGRFRRGERLSGRQLTHGAAPRHLIVLLARHRESAWKDALDDLDPFRRFETAFPALGRELDRLLDEDPASAARGLLELAARELSTVPAYPARGFDAVRRFLTERDAPGLR
jgi:hypothetical protein